MKILGGMKVKNITLNVEGMTCGNCVKSVENNVGGLDGVDHVAVELDAKKVTINYDTNKISLEKIEEEIEDIGFDVVK